MKVFTYQLFIYFLIVLSVSCESRSGKRKSRTTEIFDKSTQELTESNSQEQPLKKSKVYEVTKVVDGDTFWADNGSKKGIKVRLIGIDAPESRKTFKKEVGYFGKESKGYLSKLISGNSVLLVSDIDSLDRYGRTLSYVYLQDGTFINAEMVKNGYAMVMTVPPNVALADAFLKLQQEARENNRGLWK